MYRGTTPTNTFNVDVDCREATVLFITYKQEGRTIVEKSLEANSEDIEIEQDKISVKLSQEETLSFADNKKSEVQIRVGFQDGSRLASNVMDVIINRILKDGEI